MREKLEMRVLDAFTMTVGEVMVLQAFHKAIKDHDF